MMGRSGQLIATGVLTLMMSFFGAAGPGLMPFSAQAKAAPAQLLPIQAIGRVNIAGYRNRSFCTGILIAPKVVLTAAHCLRRGRTKRLVRAKSVHFLAGYRSGKYRAHAMGAHLLFPKGSNRAGTKLLKRDIALIVLNKPLHVQPISISAKQVKVDTKVRSASYSRKRPHRVSYGKPCEILAMGRAMWRTNCSIYEGASGAPVFVVEGRTAALVGMFVARSGETSSLALALAPWRSWIRKHIQ